MCSQHYLNTMDAYSRLNAGMNDLCMSWLCRSIMGLVLWLEFEG